MILVNLAEFSKNENNKKLSKIFIILLHIFVFSTAFLLYKNKKTNPFMSKQI